MMFGYGGISGGWPVWAVALMCIGMLAVAGVLIWTVYALMTNSSREPNRRRRGPVPRERRSGADARGVLDERLASGQIDAAEYRNLRGLIAADDDQAPAGSSGTR